MDRAFITDEVASSRLAAFTANADGSPIDSPCVCPAHGWCERHRRNMMPIHRDACRRDPAITPEGREKIMAFVHANPNPAQRPATPPPLPGLARRAANFAKAAAGHAVTGAYHSTAPEKARRRAICDGCVFLNRDQDSCSACGCPIDKKTSWADQTCPKNFWLPEVVTHRNHLLPIPDADDVRYDSGDIHGLDQIADAPTFYDALGSPGPHPSLKGRVVLVLAGGPSLATVDLGKIPGHVVTLALNNVATLVRPDLWMAIDAPAAKFPEATWADPTVHKLVPRGLAEEVLPSGVMVRDCPGVSYFIRNYRFRSDRFLTEPTFSVGQLKGEVDELGQAGGRSVLLSALKAVWVMGGRKVIVVGADFHMDPARPYAHAEPKDEAGCKSNNDGFRTLNNRLMLLRPRFDIAGMTVLNATPGGHLTAFLKRPLEVAFAQWPK